MAEGVDSGWENHVNAQRYNEFASTYPLYSETSRDLIKLVGLKEGMTVVDLACGTGVTTKEILKGIGETGKVFAIDQSSKMLDQTKKNITADNVTFLNSSAEAIDEKISEKVDAVICNSAIWQMNLDSTMEAVGKILKTKGLFAFSVPGQFYKFQTTQKMSPQSMPISLIMYGIAKNKYGLTRSQYTMKDKLSNEQIVTSAKNSQLSVTKTDEISYQRTPEEIYNFEKIPIMTERLLPGLDYDTRMKILDEAYDKLDKSHNYPNRWIYYLTIKTS